MDAAQPLRPPAAGVSDACQAVLSREPALVIGLAVGVVDAALVALFAFVPAFTADQRVAVIGLVSALMTAVGALATRSRVSPVAGA